MIFNKEIRLKNRLHETATNYPAPSMLFFRKISTVFAKQYAIVVVTRVSSSVKWPFDAVCNKTGIATKSEIMPGKTEVGLFSKKPGPGAYQEVSGTTINGQPIKQFVTTKVAIDDKTSKHFKVVSLEDTKFPGVEKAKNPEDIIKLKTRTEQLLHHPEKIMEKAKQFMKSSKYLTYIGDYIE